MAIIKVPEDFIRQNPNILYVLQTYFDDVDEIKQDAGNIFYRVTGSEIPDGDELISINFLKDVDGFLQIDIAHI